ncbi:MAG: hypothetical protein M3O31_07175 [Acidobacteriota bacterium]|nr:hypothetical protein [Acidobacteriota bacterium]
MQPETLAILTNKSVIAIDQDSLGSQARRLSKAGNIDIWSRPRADGGHAIGIFNRGAKQVISKLSAQDLKIAEDATAVHVWTNQEVRFLHGVYEATLPPHAALFLRVAGR